MATQALRQVAVQLNHRQGSESLHQRLRQRRQAGANFDHELAREWINRSDDGIDDAAISQEMLPKTFAGNVFSDFQAQAFKAVARECQRRRDCGYPEPRFDRPQRFSFRATSREWLRAAVQG